MVLFSTQAGKINKILPPTHALLPKIPIFQEKEISSSNVKKLLYLSKENFSYIPGNGTLHFSTQAWKKKKKKRKTTQRKFTILTETETSKKFIIFSQKKAVLIFQKTEVAKKLFIFQETELWYRDYTSVMWMIHMSEENRMKLIDFTMHWTRTTKRENWP